MSQTFNNVNDAIADADNLRRNIAIREHADSILEMIDEEAASTYQEDNDLRLKFLNLMYYRMAERCGLVPHGEEMKIFKTTMPAIKETKTIRRRKRVGSDGTVWCPMEGCVMKETEKAFIIQLRGGGSECIPKSQLMEELEEGQEIDGVWVTEWIADQKDWERD